MVYVYRPARDRGWLLSPLFLEALGLGAGLFMRPPTWHYIASCVAEGLERMCYSVFEELIEAGYVVDEGDGARVTDLGQEAFMSILPASVEEQIKRFEWKLCTEVAAREGRRWRDDGQPYTLRPWP